MSSETKITEADRQALESGNQEIGLTAHYDNNTKSVQIPLNVKVGDKYVLNTTGKRVAQSDYIVFLADGETEQQVRARLKEKGIHNPTVLGSVSQDGFVAKEPTPSFTSIQPPKPSEPTTTQPGEAANDETLQQLIGAGNKADQNNGAALEALAWVGNIFRHIPIGVGMVAKETIEAGERFYDRTWAQRGDAALSWGRNVVLAASNLNIQSIAKANFNAYASYLYNPEPFNSFAADRSQNGLSAQIGIGIGKNLTYGAATGAVLSPFAGGGGATSILNGETIPWRNVPAELHPGGKSKGLPVLNPKCFVAGTLIHTKTGLVPIETIKVGDEVLSQNLKTGQLEYKSVLETFIRYATELLTITIEGEKDPLGVTPEHPFWARRARSNTSGEEDPDQKADWIEAGQLKVGDWVQRPSGQWVEVVKIEPRGTAETVYNFKVAENHDYFAGTLGTLVHNADYPTPPGGRNGRILEYSDTKLEKAAQDLLKQTKKNRYIEVETRSQAEEIFLREFQGDGYRNTTGWQPGEIENWYPGKRMTYHWDDTWDPANPKILMYHNPADVDAYTMHLQIHDQFNNKTRIFFNKK